MKRIGRALLGALCLLLLSVFLFSGWKLFSILRGYRTAERHYSDLTSSVVALPSPTPRPDPAPAPAASAPPAETPQPEEVIERSPISVDFDALSRRSGDVVGWLYLPQSALNYPVVQGSDNEYYLSRFMDGTPSGSGTLFVDFVCPSDFSGRNTIIYGHNMRDGSMFAVVDDYAEQSFFEAHPVLYLNTPGQNYRIELFSGFTSDPEGFVYTTFFRDDADFSAFLDDLLAASEIDCGVSVSASDRIVTLSTCTYSAEDVRFVLCGKLVEIG